MGSDSDLPCMKDAAEQLEAFGIPYEITIVSAHRTPQKMFDYAKSAPDRGIKVPRPTLRVELLSLLSFSSISRRTSSARGAEPTAARAC